MATGGVEVEVAACVVCAGSLVLGRVVMVKRTTGETLVLSVTLTAQGGEQRV